MPAPIRCFRECPDGNPPLRPCTAFAEGFGEGGCASTCIGAISSANMALATDLACPAAVAVVPVSLPIIVSDEQQAMLADTDSDEFAEFAQDFAGGVAATMDTVAPEQIAVISVGARRRQLSNRRRMPELTVGKCRPHSHLFEHNFQYLAILAFLLLLLSCTRLPDDK